MGKKSKKSYYVGIPGHKELPPLKEAFNDNGIEHDNKKNYGRVAAVVLTNRQVKNLKEAGYTVQVEPS